MLREAAPAKINLALHLRARRADGYHDLETLFAFTDFGDTLTAEPADDLSLAVEGEWAAPAGAGADNLVLKAARALQAVTGTQAGAALTLDKRIPVAAGLGGGSADAAAALRLLNRLWGLGLDAAALTAIAAPLGADVAACVASRTCLGTGKGDVLAPWAGADPAGTPVLLVNPRVPVPTGPVFAGWDRIDRGGIDPALPLVALRNDMTPAARALQPVIGDVLAALESAGDPLLVRMSGSGATCLALYRDSGARDEAALRLVPLGWWLSRTQIL